MSGYRIAVTREYIVLADTEHEAVLKARILSRKNETVGLVYAGHEVLETMPHEDALDILQPEPDAVFLRDGDGTTYSTTL